MSRHRMAQPIRSGWESGLLGGILFKFRSATEPVQESSVSGIFQRRSDKDGDSHLGIWFCQYQPPGVSVSLYQLLPRLRSQCEQSQQAHMVIN